MCFFLKQKTETLEVEFDIFHLQALDSHAPDSFYLADMDESRKLPCKLKTNFIRGIILCLFDSAMSFVHLYVHVCPTLVQAMLYPVAAELKSFFGATG